MDSFERLRAADPMRGVEPDMSEIKSSVMAHVNTHVGKRRGIPSVAIAAALVVVAGVGGVVAGRATAPADISALPQIPVAGMGANTANTEQSKDSVVRGGFFPGARMVLKPTADIANVAGSAKAYRFIAQGVDGKELAEKVAAAIGALGDLRIEGQAISIGAQDGSGPVVWVSNDSLMSFSASNPKRSPWQCVKTDPSTGSATEECQQPNFKSPSSAEAIRQVREVFTSVGLNLDNVQFTAGGDSTSVNVQAWRAIDGKRIALNWYADVSELGVYSFSANAATLEELPEYPTIGARDAAARTSDPRWSSMGPTYVRGPDGGNAVVMPMVGMPEQGMSDQGMPEQKTPEKQGRPMVPVFSSSVVVNAASPGLLQQWLVDQVVLLPSWEYTDADGNVWAMLAISDEYIDYRESR